MLITICDDDQEIQKELTGLIKEYFKSADLPAPKIAAYDSGDSLLESGDVGDIIFLDVELPGQNGISVGREIMKINPRAKVMILTNFPDYLDEAMEFNVFRYMSKPIDKDRLFRNLKQAIKQFMEENITVDIITKDGVINCNTNDIICIAYSNRKAVVHTKNGDICSVHGINYWKSALTMPCFYETHRSYIVNMRYVKKIEKNSVSLVCEEKELIAYLTARKYTVFVNAYLHYRGGKV